MRTKLLIVIILLGWLCSGMAYAQPQDTLFVSTSQVVHLRFASDLKYLSLGDRILVAKIVDGARDFVAIRARERFNHCTTMSCLETSGAMHTFLVAYREHPRRLEVDTRVTAAESLSFSPSPADGKPSASLGIEELALRPQELYHLGVQDYGISLLCENIFVKEDVLILVLSLENSSAVSYEVATPRFAVESKRRTKRGLQYEKTLVPRASCGLGTVAPSSSGRMVFAFDKLALIRGQVFRVYFYEKGGVRNMVLTLSGKDLMEAEAI